MSKNFSQGWTWNFTEKSTMSSISVNLDQYGDFIAVQLRYFILILLSVFQCVSLVYGTIRLFKYRRFSVEKQETEKFTGKLFQLQVNCHYVIASTWILELLLHFARKEIFQIDRAESISFINGVLLWPLIALLLRYENTHKFSTEAIINCHHYFFNYFWNFQLISEITILICKFYLWNGLNLEEKFGLGFAILRIFIVGGVLYLGAQKAGFSNQTQEKNDTKKEQKPGKATENKSLDESFDYYFKQWSLLWKYSTFGRKSQVCIFICFITVAVDRVVTLYSEIVTKRLIDSMSFGANSGNLSAFTTKNDDNSDSSLKLEFRWDLLLLATILQTFKWDVSHNLRDYLWEFINKGMNEGKQLLMFKKVQDLGLRWHLAEESGTKFSIIGYGTNQLPYFLENIFFQTIPTWLDVIVYLFYVAAVYPRVLNSVIFLTTFCSLAFHYFSAGQKSLLRKAQREADESKQTNYFDALLNYETVKYFTNENYESKRFAEALNVSQTNEWKIKMHDKWNNVGLAVIRNIGSCVGSLICYWMIFNNEGLTVGDYHLFGSNLYQFYYPFLQITYLLKTFKYATDDVEKMTCVLEEKPEVEDAPDAKEFKVSSGEITFLDVHFQYVAERKILNGISFTIPAGQTFALVGSTGSGKSTIIRLLFRFFDTTSGSILIDGQDIKTVTQNSLRSAIGVIPQDTVLFHSSIRSNILYGNINSKNPEEEIIAAAKCACIHDKIETFPEKYNTVVGDRGMMLSGGERQRISIARTIMKNPPILLLDESTSSLDTHTERQIKKTLEEICKNRTTLMIAHRLSTVINADKILVLHEGKIIESGSHLELLRLNGAYSTMWTEQFTSKKTEESSDDNMTSVE